MAVNTFISSHLASIRSTPLLIVEIGTCWGGNAASMAAYVPLVPLEINTLTHCFSTVIPNIRNAH